MCQCSLCPKSVGASLQCWLSASAGRLTDRKDDRRELLPQCTNARGRKLVCTFSTLASTCATPAAMRDAGIESFRSIIPSATSSMPASGYREWPERCDHDDIPRPSARFRIEHPHPTRSVHHQLRRLARVSIERHPRDVTRLKRPAACQPSPRK